MTDADHLLAALLLTAMLAVGVGIVAAVAGFFRAAATGAIDCWRSDLF